MLENTNHFHAILWDFDGVIMNSNSVRDLGFEQVLQQYPIDQVMQLMHFHRKNGGLSRYVKFRFFFENIRNEKVSNQEIDEWAARFSRIMLSNLMDSQLLISETVEFIKRNFERVPMHIVSGSDQTELRLICQELQLSQYFKSIFGSPVPKSTLVANVLRENQYQSTKCLLIGDSINDYEAATTHGLLFMGYNNPEVESLSTYTINLRE